MRVSQKGSDDTNCRVRQLGKPVYNDASKEFTRPKKHASEKIMRPNLRRALRFGIAAPPQETPESARGL